MSSVLAGGGALPPNYQLHVFSLVDPLKVCPDDFDLNIELTAANNSQNALQVNSWPVRGQETSLCHSSTNSQAIKNHIKNHPRPRSVVDELDQRTEALHTLLGSNDPNSRPVVIYVHCEQGHDRTGELVGAYEMRYKGMSFQDVWKANADVAGSQGIMCPSYYALQSFCEWLNHEQGLRLDCCWNPTSCKPFR